MCDFQVVKLYFNNPYVGWTTKEPKEKSRCYEEAYFIKVEYQYFKLGSYEDAYFVCDE